MTNEENTRDEAENYWHDFLSTGEYTKDRRFRNLSAKIPTDPRCKICNAPYHGVGSPLMRVLGRTPSNLTPDLCNW